MKAPDPFIIPLMRLDSAYSYWLLLAPALAVCGHIVVGYRRPGILLAVFITGLATFLSGAPAVLMNHLMLQPFAVLIATTICMAFSVAWVPQMLITLRDTTRNWIASKPPAFARATGHAVPQSPAPGTSPEPTPMPTVLAMAWRHTVVGIVSLVLLIGMLVTFMSDIGRSPELQYTKWGPADRAADMLARMLDQAPDRASRTGTEVPAIELLSPLDAARVTAAASPWFVLSDFRVTFSSADQIVITVRGSLPDAPAGTGTWQPGPRRPFLRIDPPLPGTD